MTANALKNAKWAAVNVLNVTWPWTTLKRWKWVVVNFPTMECAMTVMNHAPNVKWVNMDFIAHQPVPTSVSMTAQLSLNA